MKAFYNCFIVLLCIPTSYKLHGMVSGAKPRAVDQIVQNSSGVQRVTIPDTIHAQPQIQPKLDPRLMAEIKSTAEARANNPKMQVVKTTQERAIISSDLQSKAQEQKTVDVTKVNTTMQPLVIEQTPIYLNPSALTIHTNLPEKMEAPLETYSKAFDKQLENTRYNKIPEAIRSPLEQLYAFEYIDSYGQSILNSRLTGYRKIKPEEISLPSSWKNQSPYIAQKFYAGFDELASIFTQNPNFLKEYKPDMTNNFMSEPSKNYLQALQSKFPNAPEELLMTYVLKFLETTKDRYEPKYLFFNDLTKPIKTKALDILKNPEWPTEVDSNGDYIGTPTSLQKLYLTLQSIEEVAEKVNQAQKSGLQLSLPGQISSFVSTARNFYNDPVNTGITIIKQQYEKPKNPNLPQSAELLKNISQENQTFVNNMLNDTLQGTARAIGNVAEASKDSNTATDKQSSIFEITPETHQVIQETQKQVIDAAFQRATRAIAVAEEPKSAEGKELIKSSSSTQIKKSPAITHTHSLELNLNNPEAIKKNSQNFAKNFVQTLKKFFNLSAKDEAIIQSEVANELKAAQKDQTSWWNSKPEEIRYKFQIWFHKLVTQCYNLIGKTRSNIQFIEINDKTSPTLTPKVTLIYKKTTGDMLPALIEFQGNKYTINPEQIIKNADGAFMLETPLLKKKENMNLISKLAYNPLIKNTAQSLSQTAWGEAIGEQGKAELENAYSVNPNASPGNLTITYDPKGQGMLKIVTSLEQTPVAVTAPYRAANRISAAPTIIENKFIQANSTPKLVSQSINLQPEKGDLVVPKVKIDYNAEKGIQNVILQADYLGFGKHGKTYQLTPQELQAISYDKNSGQYTIKATLPTRPATEQENFMNALYESGIKIIEQTPTVQSLQQQLPEIIKGSINFLLQANPLGIQEVIITYNPRTEQASTQILTPMNKGKATTTTVTYNPNPQA